MSKVNPSPVPVPVTPLSAPDLFEPLSDPLQFRVKATGEVIFFSPLPSKTLQHGSPDADINSIVRRFAPGGVLPPPVPGVGYYGDRTLEPHTLADALTQLRAADAAFMALPAVVRAGLANDARNLPAWLRDPDNAPVARKYGLLKPLPDSQPKAAGPDGAAGGPGGSPPPAPAA